MAVIERRECDVYKDKEAVSYKLSLAFAGGIDVVRKVDLCPRAYKRLLKFIEKGIHPPSWKPDETVPASRQQPPGPQRGVSG